MRNREEAFALDMKDLDITEMSFNDPFALVELKFTLEEGTQIPKAQPMPTS